jgi:hypothetical protein
VLYFIFIFYFLQDSGKYVPPAKRAELEGESASAAFSRLKKKLNGLLNRLSEANVASIEKEVSSPKGQN